jgi:uncharacterized protein (DUF488 family)
MRSAGTADDDRASTSPVLTVGHGTLGADALGSLLRSAQVATVVDVRRFPGSRAHPHFSREAMEEWLPAFGVSYRWEQRLGGRRRLDKTRRDLDTWWEVEAFRAYAAYTRTAEFAAGLATVLADVEQGRTAVMCSESVWWRCHRRLIADVAVLLHARSVLHLAHSGALTPHPASTGARITPDGLRYDAAP